MVDANLIVTYEPTHAGMAKSEIEGLLKGLKEKADFLKSGIDGVFFLRVSKPKEIVKKLYNLCRKDSSKFEYTFNWFPVEKWCKAELDDMKKEVKKISSRIGDNEKWKMDLRKRQYKKYKTLDLIMKLTENVNKPKVDMNKPDKIIRIDIIKNKAAVSLLESDENLNTQKLR